MKIVAVQRDIERAYNGFWPSMVPDWRRCAAKAARRACECRRWRRFGHAAIAFGDFVGDAFQSARDVVALHQKFRRSHKTQKNGSNRAEKRDLSRLGRENYSFIAFARLAGRA